MSARLIINADDLGLCDSVNRASFELMDGGFVSAASAMTVGRRFESVAEYASRRPNSDIGVHLTILSDSERLRFRPLSPPSRVRSLVDREGFFVRDPILLQKRAEPEHVLLECDRQIDKALKTGLRPTHLDGHRDAFSLRKDLSLIMKLLANAHGLPFRTLSDGRRTFSLDPGIPDDEVQGSYLGFLKRLERADHLDPAKGGTHLLVVHPGFDDRGLRAAIGKSAPWGALWRQRDYEILRGRRFQRELRERGIRLVDWKGASHTRAKGGPKKRLSSSRLLA